MKTSSRSFISIRVLVAVLIWGGAISATLAHEPGLSTVTMQLPPGVIDVAVVLSLKDAAELAGSDVSHPPTSSALGVASRDALEVTADSMPARLEIAGCSFDGSSNATVHLRMKAATISTIELRSRCFALLPLGHRQFVTIQDYRGEVLAEKLLSAKANSFTLRMEGSNTASAPVVSRQIFIDFLLLGMKHILTGYDHLLFLFSLLLVTKKLAPTLKIITAFTVAHSITLALASLNVVRIPASIVEPIIAASIIYVGLENILRGEVPKGRVLLTFAFGLIHGLGFASALREAGLGANGSGILAPLVSFNLGVELGQMFVAAITLPLLWKLTSRPILARRWVPACSSLVVLAGGYWLVQRLWWP